MTINTIIKKNTTQFDISINLKPQNNNNNNNNTKLILAPLFIKYSNNSKCPPPEDLNYFDSLYNYIVI